MKPFKLLSIGLIVLVVTGIAFAVRDRAVNLLPIDYDEDDYLRAAQQYATAIQHKDWWAFTQENYRTEHPPLNKLLYGAAISFLPQAPEIPDLPTTAPPASSLPQPHLRVARFAGALVSTVQVLALAILNPLSALFLAVSTWQIKFTSQVMLESLPSLMSLLLVLFYRRSKGTSTLWLGLSAAALGLTAASKYTYCLAGLAVLIHWLWRSYPKENRNDARQIWRWIAPKLAWIGLALAVFFLADPYLWPDPVNRLKESILYHASYAQSQAVVDAGYPLWQPLVWLFGPVPWHPGVFLVSIDLWLTVLAFFGLKRLWAKYPEFALWLGIALAFLLVWPTKWPQYILILTSPLMLASSEGFQAAVLEPAISWIQAQRASRSSKAGKAAGHHPTAARRTGRKAVPWILPGTIILLVITFFPLVYQAAMSMTDFNILSIRDGLQGGVFREAWLGLSGQVQPVFLSLDQNGGLNTSDQVEDRGEVKKVNVTRSSGLFSNKDVHFAGPVLFSMLSDFGASYLVFNLLWVLLTVGLQTALGLAVALALNRKGIRFASWWRTIYVLPWAIPEFVGAMVCLNVFEPKNGWLSLALGHEIPWQDNPNLGFVVLLICALWLGWSFMMLASTAALKMLPVEVYDAAAMDGASPWQSFRWVTWPLVMPLLAPALVIRSIYAFNQFYLFYVMRSNLFTFSTLSFYLFNTSTGGGLFSISAAINLFTVFILLGLILWMGRWTRAREDLSYA